MTGIKGRPDVRERGCPPGNTTMVRLNCVTRFPVGADFVLGTLLNAGTLEADDMNVVKIEVRKSMRMPPGKLVCSLSAVSEHLQAKP